MTLLLGILLGEVFFSRNRNRILLCLPASTCTSKAPIWQRVNKVTQRIKRKLYAEQDILQTHVFCSCLNINQSAGNISKSNRKHNKTKQKKKQKIKKRKENRLSYSLFKTRRVSREMQHDRLQASTLTYLLRSRSGVRCGDGGCTRGGGRASSCDWETR